MNTLKQNEATVEPAYISTFKNTMTGSWAILERAQQVIPGGISHFPRWHDPYPLYCARASGSRMWDADGNEYIDLWMAHYDALLGHSPEPVVNALREILADGLHVGIPMEYEVKLATMITDVDTIIAAAAECAKEMAEARTF